MVRPMNIMEHGLWRPLLAALLAGLASASLSTVKSPGPGGRAPLQPLHVASPTRRILLHVDPTERHGVGAAQYRVERDGALVWDGLLPVTLQAADVTDSGFVAGYALCEGPIEDGHWHLVVLDPRGAFQLDEEIPHFAETGCLAHPDQVYLGPLVAQEALDRVLFTVDGVHRAYRLSTGERLADVDLSEPFEVSGRSEGIHLMSLHAVPDTNLLLGNWNRWTKSAGRWSIPAQGAAFSLLDPGGSTVWSLDRPGDYEVPGNEVLGRFLEQRARANGMVETAEGGRFRLWLPKDSVKIEFSTRAGPEGWLVDVVHEEPVHFPTPLPALELSPIGSVDLDPGGPAHRNEDDGIRRPVRRALDPCAILFDGTGRILVQDKTDSEVHVFDSSGAWLFACRSTRDLRMPRLADEGQVVIDAAGSLWLPFPFQEHMYLRRQLYLQVTPAGVPLRQVELSHESIVTVPGESAGWASEDTRLVHIDLEGNRLGEIVRRGDGAWFHSIADHSLAADGSLLVVRDGPERVLSISTKDGLPHSSIELPPDCGGRLTAAGRWCMLADRKTSPILVDLDSKTLFRAMVPGREAGKDTAPWTWTVAPDGHELWAVDRTSLRLHRFALPH